MKVKDFGQVFTPKPIVNDILDISNYCGENILKKHVMENSCGNGAFLVEIVDRYIKAYYEKNKTYDGIKQELEQYVHGIEYDSKIYEECLQNLKAKTEEYNIKDVNFDIVKGNTLIIKKYNKKMDFVLGNPPYVRVHNLEERYDSVKKYSFCENGMTDLYIVFYEIGINMLKENGVLCYISPNSFYNSIAAKEFREYIRKNQNVEVLMDLGHYQPFNVTTYTTICKICKDSKFNTCKYYKYNVETGRPKFISNINYDDLFIDNNIILSENNKKYYKYLNYNLKNKIKVEVKNGFATLCDRVFIQDDFKFNKNIINIIKASTGQWKKCIYPYDKDGKVIPFNKLEKNMQNYLEQHKKELTRREIKEDCKWYEFGRSQAIKDVKKRKISINNCIKDINSIKINLVKENEGVYSGLYMLTDIPYEKIRKKICSQEFIEYLKILNKCKRGGYFTFSSKDLSKFINCSLEGEINEG